MRLRHRALVALVMIGFGAKASAEFVKSEQLHQAEQGNFELTPGIGGPPGQSQWPSGVNAAFIKTTSYKNTASGVKQELDLLPINLVAEYGLSSIFSVGIDLSYATASVSYTNCTSGCASTKANGLFDPEIFVKGRADLGAGTLSYGFIVNIAVENGTIKSSGDQNLASGGIAIDPFFAWQMAAGPGIFGARVQDQISVQDDKIIDQIDDPASTSKDTPGNLFAIDAFYEFPVASQATLGFDLKYATAGSGTLKPDGGQSRSDNNAQNAFTLQVYAPIKLQSVTLLPHIEYLSDNYTSSSNQKDSATGVGLGFAARFNL